ncbi:hypothetical protein [Kineosporia sp. NBRC 101731]|uniref:hypothetical protein n=1 Tax=Kineosporia sp. NBRC 101731 TaxID=3032199 RepID=UPI0025539F70|nr:hypothetical protein [Kineosporia sp. NBRC 101731]
MTGATALRWAYLSGPPRTVFAEPAKDADRADGAPVRAEHGLPEPVKYVAGR